MTRANPFSAARFTAGALPWLGPAGELDALAERAFAPRALHQLVGPHGSGKSTLLVHLERAGVRRGLAVRRVRAGRATVGLWREALRGDVLLLDEGETLGALFSPVLALTRLLRLPTVVALHADRGLPTLRTCRIDVTLAAAAVAALHAGAPVDPAGLAERLARHEGNLREVFFELYDEVERGAARL